MLHPEALYVAASPSTTPTVGDNDQQSTLSIIITGERSGHALEHMDA